ncbi:hypothetical protein SKAU_G00350340 [Synaphobranchus kaupii]|uniref:Ubiquitin carboxyl-terminal hydrolase n=1 Tax=Synaphobranchus kaupii TaxID=118154 RepID=A0A9Q1EKC8_SYNKA|nr:hypothetical protein SKAU_G00350340 [Synaphobranchus kaupii]
MAIDTWAVAVTESQWAPEECPQGQPVSVTTDRDSSCAPNLFRSWKVRTFTRIKSGPTGPHHRQPAKELFVELLGKRVIKELCKKVNGCSSESIHTRGQDGEKQVVQGSDLLAWTSVALQGGLIPGDGNRKAAGMVATVEKWRQRFQKSLSQSALLNLNGCDENAEGQWDAFYNLQGKISRNFQTLYTPGCLLCVKKYALSYKGHPAECHMKMALLCEVESGYVCNFFLYSPEVLQKGSKSPVTEQVLHWLLRPYYNKGYNVQLDSSAHMEGRLSQVFSGLGVNLEFVNVWAGEDNTVRTFSSPPSPSGFPSKKQGDSATEDDSAALLRAHLQGWVGPVLLPWASDTSEHQSAVFLQGFWLVVHLGCIDAFVLYSLRSRAPSSHISLRDFTYGLATELAVGYLPSTPLTTPLLSSLSSQPNVQKAAISREEEDSRRHASMVQCPGLCGLVNCGNSCYMNAVLQCLLGTVPLVEHFLDRRNRSKISSLESQVAAGPFLGLVEEVWLVRRDSWTPSEMRDVVCTLHPQFDNSCQQDAQELLLFLLNAIHDDLKTREDKQEGHNSPDLQGESSIVTQLFEGQLSYLTVCMDCSHQIQQNQVFTMLSLPVPNHVIKCSLQDCLALFFQQSTLTNTERRLCPECGLRQDTAVKTTLVKPPDILVLHLKRFECRGNHKKKLKTNVVFPLENLDLTPFSPNLSPRHSKYSLYAVVNHTGNLDMGHYTAYLHNAHTRSWHKFDDAAVSDVQDHLVQSLGAYILLYTCDKFRRPRILGL